MSVVRLLLGRPILPGALLMKLKPDVYMIRVFEGPRHERLYRFWDVIAEYCKREVRVIWFANTQGFSHAECLNRIWLQSHDRDTSRIVITEADFLPNMKNTDKWLQRGLDKDPKTGFLGVMYAKRKAGTKKIRHFSNKPGAWFMSLAKDRLPESLSFYGDPDPANDIVQQLPDGRVALYRGIDEYPRFMSLRYPFGVHLFWSRHLNDDPEDRVSGFSVGEIQTKHDRRVRKWFLDQPRAFRDLAKLRLGSNLLA